MKLILSRKGFDSSAGGCPSPVFPDGSCYALPIPDRRSRVSYRELHYGDINVGKLVRDLTGDPHAGTREAHLDPDLIQSVMPREPGWTPSLGQTGSAQGHLSRQGVAEGDVFLFFGLFRQVEKRHRRWTFRPDARPFHGLWGWLQAGAVHRIDDLKPGELPWAALHPHFHGEPDSSNTLYVARDRLALPDKPTRWPGAGVFSSPGGAHRLTEPSARNITEWQLPGCFYPTSRETAMTYHQNMERWSPTEDGCRLRSAARGQEFVLDVTNNPAALDWVETLLKGADK